MVGSEDGADQCRSEGCEEPGRWCWWNGRGGFGPYCDDHAREQLDEDVPSYRDPITRGEDDPYVIPAGIQPADSSFPTIRSKRAFDRYVESDGEGPHLCSAQFCNDLAADCDRHPTDGGAA